MVRMERLELSRREAQVPKTCVSTDSTTSAFIGAGKENRTPVLRLEICDITIILYPLCYGAPTRTRTADLLITNQLRYQLCHRSVIFLLYKLDKNHYDPIQIYIQDIY